MPPSRLSFFYFFLLTAFLIIFSPIFYLNVFQIKSIIAESESAGSVFPAEKKRVYLTIDMDLTVEMKQSADSRGVKWYDPDIFDFLREHNVPVTFFSTGLFAETYPDVIRKLAINRNYSFQNHGYDHSSFTKNCYGLPAIKNDSKKIEQIEKTQRVLATATGDVPKYFRFPGICHSPDMDTMVEKIGLKIDNGTVIAGDPFNQNLDSIVHNILNETVENSVIIMHIGGPNAPQSLNALKKIVPELRERGFVFSLLD